MFVIIVVFLITIHFFLDISWFVACFFFFLHDSGLGPPFFFFFLGLLGCSGPNTAVLYSFKVFFSDLLKQ